jgi:hypothetical protein
VPDLAGAAGQRDGYDVTLHESLKSLIHKHRSHPSARRGINTTQASGPRK